MDPASSLATRDTVQVIFQAFHHYAGSGVGEHLGYLCTGLWTILIGLALTQSSLLRPWVGWLALLPAFCILAGILTPLGFGIAAVLTQIGYVLWSLWLLVVGVFVLRSHEREGQPLLSLTLMMSTNELHVVFGTGPVGQAVMRELVAKDKPVRLVNRRGPVVDQATLHRLLKKVRDVGMPMVSVNRGKPGQADVSDSK